MTYRDPEPTETQTTASWARPSLVIVGSMLVAGLGFASTLSTWVRAEVTTVIDTSVIEVSGADAASAVSALALVALVASVVLRIAGARLRKILACLITSTGIGLAVAAYGVQANPQAAVASQVSVATGTTAAANLYELTAMPLLGLVSGILIACCGLWAFVASGQWKNGRKYDRSALHEDRPTKEENPDEIDTWDSLTAGDDPTDR